MSSVTRSITLTLLLAILSVPGTHACAEPPVQLFAPGSYQRILTAHMDRPLLMVLWSLDCPPCQEEFPLLKEIRQRHPSIAVVMVSVDGKENLDEVGALLERYEMGDVEQWLFSNANSQRLRHEVDPRWYGELPRLYLFDKQQRRKARSGRTTRKELESWLQTIK